MDLNSDEKRYALEKLNRAIYFKLATVEYVSDEHIFRYKNEDLKVWLQPGDIIKYRVNYFVYLGYTKPTEKPTHLTHHVLNKNGESFSVKWDLNRPIDVINIKQTFNNFFK